ncbi:MAG TPA: FeoC-like transcriptional regulator [Gammaproteobacteria bacterium]|nr:FeoC-like transcriptional regulator [Gammaproteobacteria bacterium]
MSLLDIKTYLMQVKIASLSSLCIYFNCDSELLRKMLCHWMRKGCIRQFSKTDACGGKCAKCPSALTEIYEWVGVA